MWCPHTSAQTACQYNSIHDISGPLKFLFACVIIVRGQPAHLLGSFVVLANGHVQGEANSGLVVFALRLSLCLSRLQFWKMFFLRL